MRSLLDDAAVVQHQDAVAGQHGREPVRDHERGAPLHQPRPARPTPASRFRRRARRSPRRAAAAARRAGSRARWRCAGAGRRTASRRARRSACRSRCGSRLMNSAAPASSAARSISASLASGRPKRMFSRDGRGEHHDVLRHQRDAAAQRRAGSASRDAHAVERDAAGARIVEAQQQMEDRALAGARWADDRDLLALPHRERDAVEHGRVRPRRIGEAHVARTHLAARRLRQRDRMRRRLDRRLDREQLGQPLGRARGLRRSRPTLRSVGPARSPRTPRRG